MQKNYNEKFCTKINHAVYFVQVDYKIFCIELHFLLDLTHICIFIKSGKCLIKICGTHF